MAATALLACHLLAPARQRPRAEVEQVSIKYSLTDAEASAPEAAARAAQIYGGGQDPPVELGGDGKGLPPWWILYDVTPAEEKDMGSWTSVAFSPEQQQEYGVDEMGNVQNQTQFDLAIAATAPAPADNGTNATAPELADNDTNATAPAAADAGSTDTVMAPQLPTPVPGDTDMAPQLPTPVPGDTDLLPSAGALANTTTIDDSTATPEQAECAKSDEHCGEAKCCSEPGMQCYKKDEWWSSCNQTCNSMVDWVDGRWQSQDKKVWDCQELGTRAAGCEEEPGGCEVDTNVTAPSTR